MNETERAEFDDLKRRVAQLEAENRALKNIRTADGRAAAYSADNVVLPVVSTPGPTSNPQIT